MLEAFFKCPDEAIKRLVDVSEKRAFSTFSFEDLCLGSEDTNDELNKSEDTQKE